MLVPDKDITHRPRSHPCASVPGFLGHHRVISEEKLTHCDRFWGRHEGMAGTIEAGRALISRAK